MRITIRSAGVGDERVLAALNTVVQDLHCARRPDHFRPTHVGQMLLWYRERLEQPATRAWIAEDEAEAVGYVLTLTHHTPESPFARARRWLEIDQLAVEPKHRRCGIARALVGRAIDTAKRDGIAAVEATCWSFNDHAHALFRRLDFGVKAFRFELRES
jgi:ribosomal protein S18 acetylase RimI-like enzyme